METKPPSPIDKLLTGAKKIGIYIAIGMAAMQAVMFFVEQLNDINNKPTSNESGNS